MLPCDGVAERAATFRVLLLARLAFAERQAVRVTCLWTKYIKPPRLGEPVIRRERRGLEQGLDFFATHGARVEALD
jgi:hypothetical protein